MIPPWHYWSGVMILSYDKKPLNCFKIRRPRKVLPRSTPFYLFTFWNITWLNGALLLAEISDRKWHHRHHVHLSQSEALIFPALWNVNKCQWARRGIFFQDGGQYPLFPLAAGGSHIVIPCCLFLQVNIAFIQYLSMAN